MKKHKFTEQELRFTAVLYATRNDVVSYLQAHGVLPHRFNPGGLPIAGRIIEQRRGRDPILSPLEQQVYESIVKEGRLPGGGVIFIPEGLQIYALEQGMEIEACPGPRDVEWE